MGGKARSKIASFKRRSGGPPSPSHKKGDRNIFCPHYCKCLDIAITKSWEYWACFDCKFKESRQYLDDYPFTNSDTVLYHSLPPEIFMKVG